jgi:acetylornithine deacetylase/succinyl-diaminopimelate desuccinylase-like protein
MKKILENLIKLKTVSEDKKVNRKALEYIEKEASNLPLHIKKEQSNGFKSLILTTKKTKKPKILLQAHIDVVPGKEDLFTLKEKDGKYYGRGVYDMKFAIYCYLRLLKELNNDLSNLDLGVMITSDEELGGFNGVGYLLEKGYGADFAFLPDGRSNWEIEEGAKGFIHLKVKATGKEAHASRPWEGENAIEKLNLFLREAKKIFPQKGGYYTTFNIGKIKGGLAGNQVPGFAEALVDIRFVPEKSKEEILRKLNKVKSERIRLKEVISSPSFRVDVNNHYFNKFSEIAEKRYKIKRRTAFSHGSSDARFFAAKKIPTLVVKPKGGGHHGPNESIDKKDLERYYQVLKEFILEIS